MQARPAAGARACARARTVLLLVLALALHANANQYSTFHDLKHDVMKRSPNDYDSYKSDANSDSFLGESVSATEDSLSASEDEDRDEVVKAGQNTSEGALSNAISELDAALAVAQTATDGGHRRSAQPDDVTAPAAPTAPTAAEIEIAEPTLIPTSNKYDLELDHSNSGHGLNTPYTTVIQSSRNASRPIQESETLRKSYGIYGNILGNVNNPYALQPNSYLNAQVPAQFSSIYGKPALLFQNPGINKQNYDQSPYPTLYQNSNAQVPAQFSSIYGKQAPLFQNPGIYKQNYDQSPYPTLYQNTNPYTRSQNEHPTWNMPATAVGNPLYSDATADFDARPLTQTQQNPYQSLDSAKATVATESIQNLLSSSSKTLIPRTELLYLERIPGADNLISCWREGEMYNLRLPGSEECLICACVRERGRVQPACARCARCTRAAPGGPVTPSGPLAPLHTDNMPTFNPNLPALVPPAEPDIAATGPAAACAPLPYAEPFEHPLNPCQICVCQKRNLVQNDVFVSCTDDPLCVKPLQQPLLPATSNPNVPVPTPLCDKFPARVQFPHPTQRCQVCTCLRRPSSPSSPSSLSALTGTSNLHLLCVRDDNCNLPPKITTPRSYFPGQGPATSFDPYFNPNNPNANPSRPAVPPLAPRPSDFGLDIDLDTSAFASADDSSGPSPSPGPLEQDSLLFSPDKPWFNQVPQNTDFIKEPPPAGFIPELPQRPVISDFLTKPQRPGSILPQFGQEIEPQQPDGLKPTLPQPNELQPLQQDALPWPPITVPALDKPERGPLLGPPPHRSCAPYPTGTAFQHPWNSCQLCVCAEYPAPGHTSVEVNCYTKPSCCIEPPVTSSSSLLPGSGKEPLVSSPSLLPGPASSTQLQILDSMCNLKSFGVEFVNERDACQVCSCVPLGSVVVPLCRSAGDPLCKPTEKPDTAPTPPSLISYVEPKCRHQSPDRPFVSACSVCVCHIVFTLVVAKCTPQPKCLRQKEQSSRLIKELTNTGLINTSKYNQPYNYPLQNSGFRSQNLPSSRYNTAFASALNQLQGKNYNRNGPKTLSQSIGYRPEFQLNHPLEPSSLLQNMYAQNVPKYGGHSRLGPDANSLAFADHWNSQQSQAYALATKRPLTINSADAYMEAINSANLQNSHPNSNEYQKEYLQSQPGSDQQSLGQNLIQNPKVVAQAQADIADSKLKTYPPYTWSFDLKQLEADASASASAPNDASTYSPLSNSYQYTPPQMTYYPTPPEIRESSTQDYAQAHAQADSSAGASNMLLSALASAGAGGQRVTRSGRGQCAYAGDVYHRACQACYCLADDARDGELYSMCLGKPCH